MIKHIIIIVTLFLSAMTGTFAKVVYVDYNATFGVFGVVGTIKNKLTQDEKTYTIETTVELAGIAKMLMGGQTEYYASKGHIKNGLMISDSYIMTSVKKNQKKSKLYIIDHKRQQVIKRYRKWEDQKLIRDQNNTLNFYAENDLQTLYFNMNTAIKETGKVYHFKAVGLEKQKGLVSVTVPNESQVKLYKDNLGESADWYAKAEIVQKNFKKNKGDILMSVDKDGFIRKAVIKDILMYGDAQLIRIK